MEQAKVHDIFVIGGGINGCGIARDAAGRGYSVFLAEMNDLASGTSSASTKLIHGGLRYLEYYEFRLVQEALGEREVLWNSAPHVIKPLRFVLPHHKGLRPAWVLRTGLLMYDHMGGRKLLPPTKTIDLRKDPAGAPLRPGYSTAFEYSDCWANDARLVVLLARDAANRGATIRTRTEVISARRVGNIWAVEIRDKFTGTTETVLARAVVNAAGPWVEKVLNNAVGSNAGHAVRLVQGSHIVTRKLFDGDRCYMFQNADNRIIFVIPYEDNFTLIGTTDRDYTGDPGQVRISEEEIDYLLSAASEYLIQPVTRDDIVWTYSGVRPLYDDGASKAQEATRDYVLKLDTQEGAAPVLNVFGGKITTFRRLAESAMLKLEPVLGAKGPAWTHDAKLPGGGFAPTAFEAELKALQGGYPFLAAPHARRLLRAYGTLADKVLAGAKSYAQLGRHFGADLYEAELRYLVDNEWALSAEDVLWRRSKLGLQLDKIQQTLLAAWFDEQPGREDGADGRLYPGNRPGHDLEQGHRL